MAEGAQGQTGGGWGRKALPGFLFLVLAVLAGTDSYVEPDFWTYLSFAREFSVNPGILFHDAFSYLPTQDPYVFHEWLACLGLYGLHQAAGPAGVQVFKYALILAALFLTLSTARQRGASLAASGLALVLVLPFLPRAFPLFRAENFSLVFFILFLWVLVRCRETGRHGLLTLLVPAMALWCNLHGGFAAGLGLVFAFALGQALSRQRFLPYLLAGAGCLAATLASPYGPGLWSQVAGHLFASPGGLESWDSLAAVARRGNFGVLHAVFLLYAVTGFLCLAAGKRFEATDFLVLSAAVAMPLVAARYIPLALFTFAALVPAHLESALSPGTRPALRRAALAGLALLAVASCLAFASRAPDIRPQEALAFSTPSRIPEKGASHSCFYPVDAVRFMAENPISGKLVTEVCWSGYLLWNFHPAVRTAMDTRLQTVFPPEVRRLYYAFLWGAPGWDAFLETWPPDYILLYKSPNRTGFLTEHTPFSILYEDGLCVLFHRG
ncbi:MAG: hypothetical protein KKA60_12385 [Proteobacteria bacterium]|nr:hypothetical protein [Pseudomonadota bacterium]